MPGHLLILPALVLMALLPGEAEFLWDRFILKITREENERRRSVITRRLKRKAEHIERLHRLPKGRSKRYTDQELRKDEYELRLSWKAAMGRIRADMPFTIKEHEEFQMNGGYSPEMLKDTEVIKVDSNDIVNGVNDDPGRVSRGDPLSSGRTIPPEDAVLLMVKKQKMMIMTIGGLY